MEMFQVSLRNEEEMETFSLSFQKLPPSKRRGIFMCDQICMVHGLWGGGWNDTVFLQTIYI